MLPSLGGIKHIDFQDRFLDLLNFNIADKHILHQSTTDRIGFDPYGALQVVAVHDTPFGEYIPYPARHFASDDHSAMAFSHVAIPYNDVLAGYAR